MSSNETPRIYAPEEFIAAYEADKKLRYAEWKAQQRSPVDSRGYRLPIAPIYVQRQRATPEAATARQHVLLTREYRSESTGDRIRRTWFARIDPDGVTIEAYTEQRTKKYKRTPYAFANYTEWGIMPGPCVEVLEPTAVKLPEDVRDELLAAYYAHNKLTRDRAGTGGSNEQ